MQVTIPEQPGRCRWCGCSDLRGCAFGCSWANRRYTLCSNCVPLDEAMRTIRARQSIAEALQEFEFEGLVAMRAPVAQRAARSRRT